MLVNLNDVLRDAKAKKYGVGLFNTTDTDMLQAVIEAAEETKSPVVIGTAEVLLPYGELQLIAPSVIAAAKRASVTPHKPNELVIDFLFENQLTELLLELLGHHLDTVNIFISSLN